MTEVQRAQIVILHEEGVPERQMAARLSVSKTGVYQAITKHVSEGIFCDRKRSGRPTFKILTMVEQKYNGGLTKY